MSILVATDGEQVPSQTVEVGYELAQQFDEELIVLHVMPQDTFDQFRDETTESNSVPLAAGISYNSQRTQTDNSKSPSSETPYSIQDGEQNAASLTRDVVQATLDEWRNITFEGSVGEPVQEILDKSNRRDARYLVIGGRKRTAVGKAVFGSITQSILLNADLPVMTVMREE